MRNTFIIKTLIIISVLLLSCTTYKKIYTSLEEAMQSKKHVKSLKLNLCSNIDFSLYDSIYTLTSLKNLYISECSEIKSLPKNIEQLNLSSLVFCWNGTRENKIDYSAIGNISNLKYLRLGPYGLMEVFPNSFKNLKKLEYIDLKTNPIKYIPLWISELESLKIIRIEGCFRLDSLPVSQLNKLKKLKKIIASDSKFTCDSIYMKSIEKRLKCKIEY